MKKKTIHSSKMKLKNFLKINLSTDPRRGSSTTKLMIWYPTMHLWIYPDSFDIDAIDRIGLTKDFYNSMIEAIGLRSDAPDRIAVYLSPTKKYLKHYAQLTKKARGYQNYNE